MHGEHQVRLKLRAVHDRRSINASAVQSVRLAVLAHARGFPKVDVERIRHETTSESQLSYPNTMYWPSELTSISVADVHIVSGVWTLLAGTQPIAHYPGNSDLLPSMRLKAVMKEPKPMFFATSRTSAFPATVTSSTHSRNPHDCDGAWHRRRPSHHILRRMLEPWPRQDLALHVLRIVGLEVSIPPIVSGAWRHPFHHQRTRSRFSDGRCIESQALVFPRLYGKADDEGGEPYFAEKRYLASTVEAAALTARCHLPPL